MCHGLGLKWRTFMVVDARSEREIKMHEWMKSWRLAVLLSANCTILPTTRLILRRGIFGRANWNICGFQFLMCHLLSWPFWNFDFSVRMWILTNRLMKMRVLRAMPNSHRATRRDTAVKNVRRILVRGCQCPLAAWGEDNFENLTTKWCILKY